MNIDLDAKLVLSNKLVDDLKCENEYFKMHAKCLIAEPIAKKEENICCNHVMRPYFVPSVSSTSKAFLHTKETKKWRERLLNLSLHLGLILEI